MSKKPNQSASLREAAEAALGRPTENKVQDTNTDQLPSPLSERSSDFVINPRLSITHDFILGLQTAIDQTGSFIFMKDMAGRYTYVNYKVQELFNATFDEVIGKDDSQFFDLKMANDIFLNDRRVLDFGVTIEQEEASVSKTTSDKRIYWTVKKPIKNIDGQIIGMCGVSTDITELKRTEELLREGSEELKESQSIAGLGTYIFDVGAGVWKSSLLLDQIFGIDESYQRNVNGWESIIHIDDREMMHDYLLSEVIGNQKKFDKDYRIVRINDNAVRWLHGLGKLDFDMHGHPIRMHGTIQDITDRKIAEENLRVTASVFSISQEAIFITDAKNNIIDVNPAFTRITGYSHKDVLGQNPNLLSSGKHDKKFYEELWKSLQENGSWRGEIWNRRKSGEVYPEMLSISSLRDNRGNVLRNVAVFSDISNLKEHEAELLHVAQFDALTSIPNRILLADRMKQAISQTSRDQNILAVCYLDLDGFKPINDTFGHQAGDEVLIEIAKRIGVTIRGGDTVARLGGDEFVVLLLGLSKGEECVATLERLLAAIAEPIIVKNKTISVSASIGVSIYPLDDEDSDILLRHADQAMYVAKQSGKNRFHIYDVALDKRARGQSELLKNIRQALELNQFELHYQPKINLFTKKLVGAEALIRWRHPERGLLSPAEFLRQIENTDLDIAIGEWVTVTALAQIHQWRSAGFDIEVSINISGYHMESEGFVDKLQQQLSIYPSLPFGKLQIEVLETVALNDIAVVHGIIEFCRRIGISFALDDFGTGYSSLSYLSGLQVNTLKIDQSFVRDMLEDKGDRVIVQGIIALAKAFECHTVAEGVETEAHYHALLDMGCELGQGYLFSKPLPIDEFNALLK